MAKWNPVVSNTTLKELIRCPRCFWLKKVKKVQFPKGIMPGLPNGMDETIKRYHDDLRAKSKKAVKLPYQIYLYRNQGNINEWRDWKRGLPRLTKSGIDLMGAIDDMGYEEYSKKNYLVPIDFKTKENRPRDGYADKWYKLQGSVYTYLLKKAGYDVANHCLVIFYSPDELKKNGVDFKFDVVYQMINCDDEMVEELFDRAIRIMKSKKAPPRSPVCDVCEYVEQVNHLKLRR